MFEELNQPIDVPEDKGIASGLYKIVKGERRLTRRGKRWSNEWTSIQILYQVSAMGCRIPECAIELVAPPWRDDMSFGIHAEGAKVIGGAVRWLRDLGDDPAEIRSIILESVEDEPKAFREDVAALLMIPRPLVGLISARNDGDHVDTVRS